MPRMTAKYRMAIVAAREIGVNHTEGDVAWLYQKLVDNNYRWFVSIAAWGKLEVPPPQPAGMSVKIRVWADALVVGAVADNITEAMRQAGLQLDGRSGLFSCEYPHQSEARMYLKFLPASAAIKS